jgi:hypothetical protein
VWVSTSGGEDDAAAADDDDYDREDAGESACGAKRMEY